MEYIKTEDPNIIKQIETSESLIYLDRLENQITTLEDQISFLPEPKTKPDQETLDIYNDHIMMNHEEEMKDQLQKMQEFLSMLKGLK